MAGALGAVIAETVLAEIQKVLAGKVLVKMLGLLAEMAWRIPWVSWLNFWGVLLADGREISTWLRGPCIPIPALRLGVLELLALAEEPTKFGLSCWPHS